MQRNSKFLYSGFFYCIVTFLNFIILAIWGNPSFGTSDDYILSGFFSGEYTGEKEFRVVFIQIISSFFIFIFSTIFSSWSGVYSTVLVLNAVIALNVFYNYVIREKLFKYRHFNVLLSWYLFSMIIINWITLSPTYTGSGFLSTLIYFGVIIFIFKKNIEITLKKYSVIILLFIFSASLRPEVLLIIAPLSILIILINRLNLNFKTKYVSVFIIFCLVAITLNEFIYLFIDDLNWKEFDNWNLMRHEIANRQPERYLQNYLDKINWSPIEYNLFRDVAFADKSVFTNYWLERAYKATVEFRGFNGFVNSEAAVATNAIYLNLISWKMLITLNALLSIVSLWYVDITFLKKFFISVTLVLFSTFLLFYANVNLHVPDRIIFPIIMIYSFVSFLIYAFHETLPKSEDLNLNIVILITFFTFGLNLFSDYGLIHQFNKNHEQKLYHEQTIKTISDFSSTATIMVPVNIDYYKLTNPFLSTNSKGTSGYFMVGNWDTFSPHWNKRAKKLGLDPNKGYLNLLEKDDIYWLGRNSPDTSYNVELFLNQKGIANFVRRGEVGMPGELSIYSYRYIN